MFIYEHVRAGRAGVCMASGSGVWQIVRLSELSYEVALSETVCVCVLGVCGCVFGVFEPWTALLLCTLLVCFQGRQQKGYISAQSMPCMQTHRSVEMWSGDVV